MNCDLCTAWPVSKSFPSQWLPLPVHHLARLLPHLHCASLRPPVYFLHPHILRPKEYGQLPGSWSMQEAVTQKAVPRCPAFRWEQRGMPGVIKPLGQSEPYSFHPLTTEWLERGDGCFFLLGCSLEVRGWGPASAPATWALSMPTSPRVCACLGDGKNSVLQLSNGPDQTNSPEIRGVWARAMHCTGRGSLLVLLRWKVGGMLQRLPVLRINPRLAGAADSQVTWIDVP